MAVREIAFELECFEWADERLEVAGRWRGLAGRRVARPVLSVDTEAGRRKRLVALPGGHFGAAEESWRASFAWPGDPAEITAAELEVGGYVVVELPLPDRRRRRRRRPPVYAGDDALRAEVGALHAQVERLRAELAGRERENMQLRAQIDERAEGVAEAGAPTVEIERLTGEREQLTAQLERLEGERDRTRAELSAEVERLQSERDHTRTELSAEVDRLRDERDRMRVELEQLRDAGEHARGNIDDLREAFSEAAAEAEEVRDRHRAELATVEEELRAERVTIARLRTELAERPELPPPVTEPARRAAVAPPIRPMPPPAEPSTTQPMPPPAEPPPAEPLPESPPPAAESKPGEHTAPFSAVAEASSVDAPGPLRAGSRPATQPGVDDGVRPHEAADEHSAHAGTPALSLQALKSRLENLFVSNGQPAAVDESTVEDAIPGPRRSASAARARAEEAVAARRSPVERWALRVLAALLVAVLLVAFLLILTSVA
jgi:hypothetical protein